MQTQPIGRESEPPLIPMLSASALVQRALCELGHVNDLDRLGWRAPLDASAGRDSAYACLFGRDSLRMALDLLNDFPSLARTTIRRLTALQGQRFQARAEEEPGRILHEFRYARDTHAARREVRPKSRLGISCSRPNF